MRDGLYFLTKKVVLLLVLVLLSTSCGRITEQPQPTSIITESPVPELPDTSGSSPTAESEPTPTVLDEPTPESTPDQSEDALEHVEGAIYQDDFTQLDTGWPGVVFDNSYLGYHEPEWYHVEVQTANDNAMVTIPEMTFDDFTVEVELFTETSLSEAGGDYNYGLVFRRAGSQFYAFTISPVTQTWFVLKSTPTSVEVLQEGTDESIQGLGVADTLRVDARGADFFFYVNGQSVSRISDPDFASGEIGFLVQTVDNQKVHIHYDQILVREVDAPQLSCTLDDQALNLRAGPSTRFRILTTLLKGDGFEPLGRSADEFWVQVQDDESGQVGWVANDRPYFTCNIQISELEVVEP